MTNVKEFHCHMRIGTCEASRFDSNSNRTSRFEFDSKVTCRFENLESGAHAVCRHTTSYAHSLFNKNINLCAVCVVEIYVYNSTLHVAALL